MMWQSGSPGQVVRGCDGDLGTWGPRTGSRFDSTLMPSRMNPRDCLNWLWRGRVVADRPRNWLIGAFD